MSKNTKIWLWALGILAVAILAVVLFCHVVYWLMWIGLATVIVVIIIMVVYARKGAEKIEDEIDGDGKYEEPED